MRFAFVGAVLGLCLAAHPAWSQDIAAQPAYPTENQPAHQTPARASAHRPAAKARPVVARTAAAKPARSDAKPIIIPLPESRPHAADPVVAIVAVPVPKPAEVRIATGAGVSDEPQRDEPKRGTAIALLQDPLAAIPANERASLRAALFWSGGEDARPAPDEDPVSAAIKAYQKRNKAKVTGVLSDSERADLLAAAKTHEEHFGWTVAIDPATGIRMGLPGKLTPEVREARNGTRWSSRHGEIQIETFRIKTADSLNALFEAQKNQPLLKLESSYQRPDGFFVSGLLGLKQFAVRAQIKNGELRGYTVRYDQAMEGIVLPVLPAIANAFAPFPNGGTPIAALARPVDYGSGIVVTASGYIVTDRRFADGCAMVTIPGLGDADRVASDDERGLALLRVYGRNDLNPAGLAPDSATGRDLTVVGIPDPHTQDGGAKAAEVKAQLGDADAVRLREPVPVAGFAGAAVLDSQNRVLGVIAMRNAALASTAASVPPVRLVPAAAIRDFLAARNIALPQGAPGGRSAIVRVICVRQ